MSYSQNFVGVVLNAVKVLVDNAQIGIRAPQVYQTFLQNVNSNSSLQANLFQMLDQQTQGQWRNGLHQDALIALLRPWISEALALVETSLQQQSGMRPQGGYGQPQQMGYGYSAPHNISPTNSMYDTSRTLTPPPAPPMSGISMADLATPTAPHLPPDFNQGRDILIELHKGTAAELSLPENSEFEISNYYTGSYEKERVLSVEINLRVAENTPTTVGQVVFRRAPQDVVRGLFANVIRYNELFHVSMGHQRFGEIAAVVNAAYQKDNDWRAAVEVLNGRDVTREEWKIINEALCRLLNGAIYRRLRTSAGALIEWIESLDDLSELDDRGSKVTVTKHPNYWVAFNTLVKLAFERLFNPSHTVGAEDANFGDFVHCDAVAFFLGGKSKYDYGTFAERVDQQKFVEMMLTNHTVVRIPRAMILTNALDPRLVSTVQANRTTQQVLLSSVNTVGTALLSKLDYPKRGEIEAILCLEKGTDPAGYYQRINLARTLDDDLALLR